MGQCDRDVGAETRGETGDDVAARVVLLEGEAVREQQDRAVQIGQAVVLAGREDQVEPGLTGLPPGDPARGQTGEQFRRAGLEHRRVLVVDREDDLDTVVAGEQRDHVEQAVQGSDRPRHHQHHPRVPDRDPRAAGCGLRVAGCGFAANDPSSAEVTCSRDFRRITPK